MFESVRSEDRAERGGSFVPRFVILSGVDRISDDSGARLDGRDTVSHPHGANRDREVRIACVGEIPYYSPVDPATVGLEVVNDFQGARFRRAT